jgi:antirestriction protein ArdC
LATEKRVVSQDNLNAERIEGLSDLYHAKLAPATPTIQRIARVEAFFAATGFMQGGNRSHYNASSDHVHMPPLESFRDTEAYYATLGHEITRDLRIFSKQRLCRWRALTVAQVLSLAGVRCYNYFDERIGGDSCAGGRRSCGCSVEHRIV